MFEITFLRHGESQGNLEQRLQGQREYPLTTAGVQQARCLAEYWQQRGMHFDALISSPLERARHTAEIIAGMLGSTVTLDRVWSERSFGTWEGLTLDEIQQLAPEMNMAHLTLPPGGHGENLQALQARANRAIDSLIEQHPGRYLVVTHGGLLTMVFFTILGLSAEKGYGRVRFRIGNTAFSRWIFDPDLPRWYLVTMNSTAHLDAIPGQNS